MSDSIPGDNPITDRVRFWLYIAATALGVVAPWLVAREFIGQPEDDLIGRVIAALTLLAAANTGTARRAVRRAVGAGRRVPPTPPPTGSVDSGGAP